MQANLSVRDGASKDVSAASLLTLGRAGTKGAVPIAIALLMVLLGIVFWMDARAAASARQFRRESLRSIASANAACLEIWLQQCQHDAMTMRAEAGLDAGVTGILDDAKAAADDVAKRERIDAELAGSFRRIQPTGPYLGWAVLTMDGRVIATDQGGLSGETLPVANDARDRIMQRSATVCKPFRCPVAFSSDGPYASEGAAMMAALAPLVQGGRTRGTLALLLNPLERFSGLLEQTRFGQTGESYAFDRDGMLLTPSRFESELRQAGWLASDPTVLSPLNVWIREPAGREQDPSETGSSSLNRPLTRMADQATRGSRSQDVNGYPGYWGRRVIGAWRWLPEYEIGVATEMAVSEAYADVRQFRWTLWALSGTGLLAILSIWLLAPRNRRYGIRRVGLENGRRQLGQYHLVELIGRGGMGSVYRGVHEGLKREVAVKVLEGDEVNSLSITRFEREVRLTARLRHPNTIAIFDYGRAADDTFFYVMEYVDGITIQQLVRDFGRQPPERVIHLLLQICGSLSEAHQHGLVHRDVKPANILLTARSGLYDMIKVLDFGLVKQVERETMELTHSDGITGTPMYMSPESVRDASTVDERSDLYSIGAVGYTLLTGLPPFDGDSSVDICLKQLNEDPVRPSDRIGGPLPDDLQNTLMNSLRKDPEQRPHSVQDFAESLRQCRDAFRWTTADAMRWWEEAFPDGWEDTDRPAGESGVWERAERGRAGAEHGQLAAEHPDPAESTQDQDTATS